MIKNYFKAAFRRLERNKSFALINVAGLSIGVTCALIIFLIVRFELSYDRFHSKKDRIYRINTVWNREGEISRNGASQFPLGGAVRSQFSDIKVTTIDYLFGGMISVPRTGTVPEKFYETDGIVYVEPEFFEIFDMNWISGNYSLLKEPYNVALSESMARKYFPGGQAVGQILRLNNECDLKVVGITRDPLTHTDFPFRVMISFATEKALGKNKNLDQWDATMSDVNTYVLTPDEWDPQSFNERLTRITSGYLDEGHRKVRSYEVQPLSEIHFNPETGSYTYTTSSTKIWALAIIGFFLIVTACINFINLATAQAVTRSKEVGVRKVLGAYHGQLLVQFLGETLLITVVSVILSIGMTELFVPFLNTLFEFKLQFSVVRDPLLGVFILLLTLIITLGSGFYPAFVMSGYRPASVLKGGSVSHAGGLWVRKGLVILQFMIAQGLVICTIVVIQQMELFKKSDLGFIKDAVVIADIPLKDKTKMETLRNELLKQNGIFNVSFGFAPAASSSHWTSNNIYYSASNQRIEVIADMRPSDENYLATYGIQLLAGRNYTASDTMHEVVINETMMQKIGISSPLDAVGKTLYLFGELPRPIVGVVKDYNTMSLHEKIYPVVLTPRLKSYQTMSVKIDMRFASEVLPAIENAWSRSYPEFVYRSQFLDENIARFYKDEQMMSKLFTIFSSIAIGIGCLGLFGLVSFMAVQRTKEIGVRKVLGASVANILMMFAKEFAVLILIAFAVAAPSAYFVMNGWLQDFAYKISIGAETFFTAVMLTVVIAGVTVGYRSIKAATANPVDALKYE